MSLAQRQPPIRWVKRIHAAVNHSNVRGHECEMGIFYCAGTGLAVCVFPTSLVDLHT